MSTVIVVIPEHIDLVALGIERPLTISALRQPRFTQLIDRGNLPTGRSTGVPRCISPMCPMSFVDDVMDGTNLRLHTVEDLRTVDTRLNGRPRKILGWQTPLQVFTTMQDESSTVATITRIRPGNHVPLGGHFSFAVDSRRASPSFVRAGDIAGRL
jgi:hypothetical protein